VDVLVRERPGYREAAALVGVEGFGGRAEAVGASDVLAVLAAERRQPGELDAEDVRDLSDPVGDDAQLLVVGWMAWDTRRRGEVEVVADVVGALQVARRVAEREAGA